MRRLIFKNAKGTLYEIIDHDALISRYEWRRVVDFQAWLLHLARKEDVNLAEILLCMNEQI